MKKFKYRFEKILAYRHHLEKEKQRELAVVQNMELAQTQKLADLETERLRQQREQKGQLVGPIDPEKLRRFSRYFLMLKKAELSGRELLRQIQKEVEKKRLELLTASRAKKTYEKLKERHQDQYTRELNRILQKENDEIAQHRR